MRDDTQLVKLFLSEYKHSEGNAYHLAERPDVEERNAAAIEAVAVDTNGHRLAVEHALIQPFEGQKSDDLPFLKSFEKLELDHSLRVPDKLIEVIPRAFAVPRGHNRLPRGIPALASIDGRLGSPSFTSWEVSTQVSGNR